MDLRTRAHRSAGGAACCSNKPPSATLSVPPRATAMNFDHDIVRKTNEIAGAPPKPRSARGNPALAPRAGHPRDVGMRREARGAQLGLRHRAAELSVLSRWRAQRRRSSPGRWCVPACLEYICKWGNNKLYRFYFKTSLTRARERGREPLAVSLDPSPAKVGVNVPTSPSRRFRCFRCGRRDSTKLRVREVCR